MAMLYAGAVIAGLLFLNTAHAASAVGHVAASVVERLTIANLMPLDFGHITPGVSGGSVTVTPNNTRSVSGSVQVGGEPFHRATFKVEGAPGKSYSIHTPSSQVFVTSAANSNASLTNSLTVSGFTVYSVGAGTSSGSGTLNGSGQDDVFLGGTIIVPANAVPGVYSGLVPLTVSY